MKPAGPPWPWTSLVQVSWDFAEKSLSTNIVDLAVRLGCQRMMESAGAWHKAARWEEARWQLQHVVATEPNPHVEQGS
ncbi:hypothetical protein [Streptomyces sp. NPDC002853]